MTMIIVCLLVQDCSLGIHELLHTSHEMSECGYDTVSYPTRYSNVPL